MANPILQLLEALRNMFTCDIGIDLGTANTLVYMKGRGIIIREPSVVAVDARTDELRVRCVGHEAKAIIGAAPNSILAVRPLKDGVIADFDITAAMLQSFIRQACGSRLFVRPRVVICVPSGVTEVERRAVRQAAAKAGARQVTVIEEPMAAAIGAGLPTAEPVGSMIVDIGGGTAEVAVISLSGIVASRSVRCAGDALDQSITSFIKRKYNLLVGERTAEQIKLEIGSACPPDPTDTEHGETTMEIKGRALADLHPGKDKAVVETFVVGHQPLLHHDQVQISPTVKNFLHGHLAAAVLYHKAIGQFVGGHPQGMVGGHRLEPGRHRVLPVGRVAGVEHNVGHSQHIGGQGTGNARKIVDDGVGAVLFQHRQHRFQIGLRFMQEQKRHGGSHI